MSLARFVEDFRSSYIGNATARRDYRVQLRGSRSVILFGLYLVILIVVAMIVYDGVTSQAQSMSSAQAALQAFYQTIIALLGGLVAFITPALSATTVVMERQRRSFDLIFSAPVSPRYYMIGKMISSFRYTWMLLMLALPVAAASVILGGASWFDVLGAYALLSMHALIFTAIAMLMSTITSKPVSAVLGSYAAVGTYLAVTTAAAASETSGAGSQMSPLSAMSPFSVTQAVGTHSLIFGIAVPNLLLAALLTGAITKITLLAAGSTLSPYGSAERKSLRVHGLLYSLLGSMAVGYWTNVGPTEFSQKLGILGTWLLFPICLALPVFTCFGYDGERINWPNGLVKFRRMLDGTPAGALPFVYALTAAVFGGTAIGAQLSGHGTVGGEYLAYPLFSAGLLTLIWSFGRFISSLVKSAKQARPLHFASFFAFAALPVPIIAALTGAMSGYERQDLKWLWNLCPLYPVTVSEPWRLVQVLLYGLAMLVTGGLIAFGAERRVQGIMREDLLEDERTYGMRQTPVSSQFRSESEILPTPEAEEELPPLGLAP